MNYIQYQHPSHAKLIYVVPMNDEPHKHYSELMQQSIGKQLSLGRTVLIICNKQGHSSGMLCTQCGHIPRCHQCDIAIAYHQTANGDLIGLCHICKMQYPVSTHCSQCHSDQVKLYGVGIQQVAKRCHDQYHIYPLIIDSTKTSSLKKMEKLTPILQSSQLIIATSLLRTPASDKQIDLIVLLHADQWLQQPHYRANQDNYESLRDMIDNYPDTRHTIIQTFKPEHPALLAAIKHDPAILMDGEHLSRKHHLYPPYGEMASLLYKHEIEERLFGQINKLYQELLYLKQTYGYDQIDIYPTPALIYKMYSKYHYTIILKGTQVRNLLDIAYSKLKIPSRGFKVQWER